MYLVAPRRYVNTADVSIFLSPPVENRASDVQTSVVFVVQPVCNEDESPSKLRSSVFVQHV